MAKSVPKPASGSTGKKGSKSRTQTLGKSHVQIDLGNLQLEDEARLKLLNKISRAVGEALMGNRKQSPPTPPPMAQPTEAAVRPAVITVVVKLTDPGKTEIRARHKGVWKTLRGSGAITFNHVSRLDYIDVQGSSLGEVIITIDRQSQHPAMHFLPGEIIAFDYEILD